MPSQQMEKSDSSRIQSSQVIAIEFHPVFYVCSLDNISKQAKSGGDMSSRGFAARAQSAADRNNNLSTGGYQGATDGGTGGSGGSRGGSLNGGAGNVQGSGKSTGK